MSSFPKGWFYIECSSKNNQVLTVPNMSIQPTTRVELRPKKTLSDHQLWCHHQGFLINKHSGCVLGVETEKRFNNQPIYQQKRLEENENRKRQQWTYKDSKLILIDDSGTEFALNDLAVPKVVNDMDNASVYNLVVK